MYNLMFDDEVDQEQRNDRVEEESDTDAEHVPPDSGEGNFELKEATLEKNSLSENLCII